MSAKLRHSLVAASLLLAPFPGMAAVICTMAVSGVAFGSYDVSSLVSSDAEGSIVVTCDRSGGPLNTTVTISIGPSATSGTVNSRTMQMSGGTDQLAYNLFRDAGRTLVWGETPGIDTFTQIVSPPNKGSAQFTATIYGRIPAGLDVSAGSYSDSVVVTVTP